MSFNREDLTEIDQLVGNHVKRTVEPMLDAMEGWQKSAQKSRDELERKMNIARLGSAPSNDGFDPQAVFERSVKSWNPARASELLQGADYSQYKTAFGKYTRFGLDALSMDERKYMQVGSDSDGGFLVTSEFLKEIIRVESNNSVMRRVARIIPMGRGELEVPASLTRPETGWVGETATRSDTDNPSLGKHHFVAKEIYAQPKATQKLLDDSEFDIESFLGEEVGLAFAEAEDLAFISGDGIATPRGFTTYDTAATADATRAWGVVQHIATGQAGAWPTTDALIYDKLVDVTTSLRPRYRKNARWIMGTEAINKLRKMKTATTLEPLWQPSLTELEPDRLLGYPVVEAEQMPAVGANSLSVAFGDFRRAYWILDRTGVRLLRDPYTDKPFVKFYTTKRVTGGVADSHAIKLLKFAAA